MKKVKAIVRNKKGEIVSINLAADAGNADWIRTARLLKAGKAEEAKKLFDTPMSELEDESDEKEREDY